jgi:hypothetical protein
MLAGCLALRVGIALFIVGTVIVGCGLGLAFLVSTGERSRQVFQRLAS